MNCLYLPSSSICGSGISLRTLRASSGVHLDLITCMSFWATVDPGDEPDQQMTLINTIIPGNKPCQCVTLIINTIVPGNEPDLTYTFFNNHPWHQIYYELTMSTIQNYYNHQHALIKLTSLINGALTIIFCHCYMLLSKPPHNIFRILENILFAIAPHAI